MKHPFLPACLALLAVPALAVSVLAADLDARIPPPAFDPPVSAASETAILAGGCFWGQQGLFEHVKGVTKVVAGYSGGTPQTATYAQVSSETTGHAESVAITFDPRVVSYGRILQIYFSVAHDPTELDRQGPDEGSSYRSEIFYANAVQEKVARAYVARLSRAHVFSRPIVTRIAPLKGFYPAEAYHQDYMVRHPRQLYIVLNDLPKLRALKAVWPQYYRAVPILLAGR